MSGHSKEDILSVLRAAEVAAIATAAGDTTRNRMMHYAVDDAFTIYLATLRGDPKTVQISTRPSVALLVYSTSGDLHSSREVEVTGKAVIVTGEEERSTALEATARRSPVVDYLVSTGNADTLDCIKIVPDLMKLRVFSEIVKGLPPTVIEFPSNRAAVSDWQLLRAKARSWVAGLRAPFLTASLVPVLLGAAVAAAHTGTLLWGLATVTLFAALLLHVGANLLNDYSDHLSGNDEANREFVRPFSGGSRVIQLGLLTPREVLVGGVVAVAAGVVLGLALAWLRGPLLLVLGAVGVASAVFYTGRPLNWASRGVGELLVGANFGVLMALGAYYVQTASLSWTPVLAGLPVSLLIAAVLLINEFPDETADRAVGKKTLVVRLGRARAVWAFGGLLGGAYAALVLGAAAGALPSIVLLGLITAPAAAQALWHARTHHDSSFDLAPANALTITVHLATGLLLSLAFAWQAFGQRDTALVAFAGVVFALFVIYMYRSIERQKRAFFGLKQAMR